MFPIFISTNDEDGAIWGLISAVVQDEKSKEVYAVPLKSTHLAFLKGRIEKINNVEDFQQTIRVNEGMNNDDY